MCPTQNTRCSAVAGRAEVRAGRRTGLYHSSLAVRLGHQHHAINAAWATTQTLLKQHTYCCAASKSTRLKSTGWKISEATDRIHHLSVCWHLWCRAGCCSSGSAGSCPHSHGHHSSEEEQSRFCSSVWHHHRTERRTLTTPSTLTSDRQLPKENETESVYYWMLQKDAVWFEEYRTDLDMLEGNRLDCQTELQHRPHLAEPPSVFPSAGTGSPDHTIHCTHSTLSKRTWCSPLEERKREEMKKYQGFPVLLCIFKVDTSLTTVSLIWSIHTVLLQVTSAVQVNTLPTGTRELFAGAGAGHPWSDCRSGCGAWEDMGIQEQSALLINCVWIFLEIIHQ